MATQAPVRADQQRAPAQAQVAEREAWSTQGIKVLVAGVWGARGRGAAVVSGQADR